MPDDDVRELPVDVPPGEAGVHAAEAFGLLGNDIRLAILLALWAEHDPHAEDNAVPFSDIFDRVDYEDPGNFSYHLDQLEGQFIRQRAEGEGYELRDPAKKFIQVIIAGAGVKGATQAPTSIDEPCPFCGATMTSLTNGEPRSRKVSSPFSVAYTTSRPPARMNSNGLFASSQAHALSGSVITRHPTTCLLTHQYCSVRSTMGRGNVSHILSLPHHSHPCTGLRDAMRVPSNEDKPYLYPVTVTGPT